MEAFSLLKYWRGGGGGGVFPRDTLHNHSSSSFSSSGSTTIVTTVTPNSSSSSDSDDDEEGNDDGPFFDLEFTLSDDDADGETSSHDQIKSQLAEGDVEEMAPKVVVLQESLNADGREYSGEGDVSDDDDQNDGTAEIKFTISSDSTGDPNNTATPSDSAPSDKGMKAGSSTDVNAAGETTPKFPVPSILKSATKFRVQMPKFNNKSKKASKSEAPEKKSAGKNGQQEMKDKGEAGSEDPKPNANNKLLTVKLKVEEVMPLISLLFSRDHNSSSANSKGMASNSKANKRNGNEIENGSADAGESATTTSSATEEERKFAKELMNKYLKKVKPLYVRVSKRYGDKLKFSGQLSSVLKSSTAPPTEEDAEKPNLPEVKPSEEGTAAAAAGEEVGAASTNVLKGQKQGNLQAGLRVVCKHLGKSRSASASAPAPAPVPVPAGGTEMSRRRDDSLLLQQDGIQSAIMHCKRSFNASRDPEGSILSRSVRISDPSSKK